MTNKANDSRGLNTEERATGVSPAASLANFRDLSAIRPVEEGTDRLSFCSVRAPNFKPSHVPIAHSRPELYLLGTAQHRVFRDQAIKQSNQASNRNRSTPHIDACHACDGQIVPNSVERGKRKEHERSCL